MGSVTAFSMGPPGYMRLPNPIENKGSERMVRPAPLRDDRARMGG
jgi:hypothetical protein